LILAYICTLSSNRRAMPWTWTGTHFTTAARRPFPSKLGRNYPASWRFENPTSR
jgi:hypothetical protein